MSLCHLRRKGQSVHCMSVLRWLVSHRRCHSTSSHRSLSCRSEVYLFPQVVDSILRGRSAAGPPLTPFLPGLRKDSVPPLSTGTRGVPGRLCRARPFLLRHSRRHRQRHHLLRGGDGSGEGDGASEGTVALAQPTWNASRSGWQQRDRVLPPSRQKSSQRRSGRASPPQNGINDLRKYLGHARHCCLRVEWQQRCALQARQKRGELT